MMLINQNHKHMMNSKNLCERRYGCSDSQIEISSDVTMVNTTISNLHEETNTFSLIPVVENDYDKLSATEKEQYDAINDAIKNNKIYAISLETNILS